ncbi:EEF1A lysine methyltransferase 2 isoform X2 [Bufo gargarizans]|uniref:EEF1A lysine methyltransferase 2 isoform X2 n=1 Tax=Bufo gargarizans TaxID=30331 RepID=UPI001CF39C1D|nr:EEF1A lysine methyltransferase 2 isoform X2 [Bufo gargarizans]XP_044153750.1 EEF1A lysine methyltransferase 2 isoform X2 [Bufo gargarizans]
MAHDMTEAEFSPSVLGTKEHWDTVYSRELKTFQEYGDEGEIWFGEGSMTRVVRWLNAQNIPLTTSIVDIGTGNGMLLVELAKSGFSSLLGIDYCADAVALARNICEREGVSQSVNLQVADFLGSFSPAEQFDIGLDKGTFDAVSLDPSGSEEKRRQYLQSLCRVLKPNGIFIITSCNWTKDELLEQFGNDFPQACDPNLDKLEKGPVIGLKRC